MSGNVYPDKFIVTILFSLVADVIESLIRILGRCCREGKYPFTDKHTDTDVLGSSRHFIFKKIHVGKERGASFKHLDGGETGSSADKLRGKELCFKRPDVTL
ncbi:hypothetical protein ES703_108530 [subsurface metagenome]